MVYDNKIHVIFIRDVFDVILLFVFFINSSLNLLNPHVFYRFNGRFVHLLYENGQDNETKHLNKKRKKKNETEHFSSYIFFVRIYEKYIIFSIYSIFG
jgi:hypothetical protein